MQFWANVTMQIVRQKHESEKGKHICGLEGSSFCFASKLLSPWVGKLFKLVRLEQFNPLDLLPPCNLFSPVWHLNGSPVFNKGNKNALWNLCK